MWVPTIPAQLVFCHLNQTTFFQLLNGGFSPNLATTHESIYPRNVLETMFENFQFGGYLTQNIKIAEGRQVPIQMYSDQHAQGTHTLHSAL